MSSVDSPPGAGKTRLVEGVVATAVQRLGLSVAVATPRAEQSFDVLRRLSANFDPMQIEVLQSNRRFLPSDLRADPQVAAPVSSPGDLLGGRGVVVGAASKFVASVPRFRYPQFQLLVCDEAYQLPAKDIDPLVTIAEQVLLVGDPGQLPPLVKADPARFEAARYRVHRPAPEELLRRYPGIPREQLPATFCFPQATVDLVQPSFYPHLPFGSGVPDEERRFHLRAAGIGTPIDRALDLLAEGASVVGILAPEKPVGQGGVDDEIAAIMARMCRRALDRGPEWEGEGRLGPADIGCADAHVASGAAVRRHLLADGIREELVVETPEIWQGLQRPLMVVKHTLSGLLRVDPFSLQPGRTCVMLSRHQVGCVIVGRDGVGEALDRYQHDSGARASAAEDATWSGWRARATLWEQLERSGRLIRIA